MTWWMDGGGGTRLSPTAWLLLILVSLVILWPGQTTIPVMDRDEARYAQAARQMLETGDFIDIHFQDETRYVKPAGIYWMEAATAALVGGGADAPIWAYRLPSLLGALAAVVITAWLGARMAGPAAGLTAGVLMALSLVVAVEARTAKTDAVLTAVIALAQAALYLLWERDDDERPRFFGAPLVFWAATGVGLMVKGPITLLVSGTTIAALCLFGMQWRWLRRLRIGPGLLIMILVAAPWLVAITIKTHGGFLEESVGHALLGKVARSDDSHGAPPGYHTLLLFVTFWPGALFTGLAAVVAWTRRRQRDVQFLIAWIVPTWIVFEVVVTKLPHYTLPVFPAIAVLAGMAFRDAPELLEGKAARWLHLAATVLFVVVAAALALVPVAAELYLQWSFSWPSLLATGVGVGMVAIGVWLARRPRGGRLALFVAAVAVFYGITFHVVMPRLDSLWVSQRLADRVAALTGCESVAAATAGYREPSNVFVLGTHTLLGDGATAAQFLTEHGGCSVAAVDQTHREAFLKAMAAAGDAVRTVGHVEGINYSKGRPLSVDLYVLDTSPLEPPKSG